MKAGGRRIIGFRFPTAPRPRVLCDGSDPADNSSLMSRVCTVQSSPQSPKLTIGLEAPSLPHPQPLSLFQSQSFSVPRGTLLFPSRKFPNV